MGAEPSRTTGRTVVALVFFALLLLAHVALIGYVAVAALLPDDLFDEAPHHAVAADTPVPSAASASAEEAGAAAGDAAPQKQCDTPYGTYLGTALGVVKGYSNCHDGHISFEPAHVPVEEVADATALLAAHGTWTAAEAIGSKDTTTTAVKDGVQEASTEKEDAPVSCAMPAADAEATVAERRLQTGMMWQCVEFARRALLLTRGVVFGSVEGAADIWEHGALFDPREKARAELHARTDPSGEGARYRLVPWRRISNDARLSVSTTDGTIVSPAVPAPGDVVIWARQPDMPYGHVAVVTAVSEDGAVRVAEQNYDGHPWPGDHSRALRWAPPGDVRTKAGYKAAATDPAAYPAVLPKAVRCLTDPAGYGIVGWLRAPPVASAMGDL